MAFLVKGKDMGTAPLEELKYSKKRCDKLRNFLSGLCCIPFAFASLETAISFVIGLSKFEAREGLMAFIVIASGIFCVVFSVLSKEECKYFWVTVVFYAIYGLSTLEIIRVNYVLRDDFYYITSAAFAAVSVPCYIGSVLLRNYNAKLACLEGYPSFTSIGIKRKYDSTSREQAKEIYKTNGIVNPDDFFTVDKAELEKPKDVDKSDWLSG